MNDSRDLVAPLRLHVLRQQHERRVLVAVEYLVRALGKNDRREWTEGLPVLDALVELVLHLGLARVGQNAAVAKRARTEFGPPLEPAEHVALGQELRCLGANVIAALCRGLQPDQRLADR